MLLKLAFFFPSLLQREPPSEGVILGDSVTLWDVWCMGLLVVGAGFSPQSSLRWKTCRVWAATYCDRLWSYFMMKEEKKRVQYWSISLWLGWNRCCHTETASFRVSSEDLIVGFCVPLWSPRRNDAQPLLVPPSFISPPVVVLLLYLLGTSHSLFLRPLIFSYIMFSNFLYFSSLSSVLLHCIMYVSSLLCRTKTSILFHPAESVFLPGHPGHIMDVYT